MLWTLRWINYAAFLRIWSNRVLFNSLIHHIVSSTIWTSWPNTTTSQDIILPQRNEDLDDEETVIPPSTPITHSVAKKPRTDNTDEDMYQTTLTQQWQRTTMTQMSDIDHTEVALTGDQDDNTVNSMDDQKQAATTPAQRTAIVNPYSKKKQTPLVTPQTHTKNKPTMGTSTTTTRPPFQSLPFATQLDTEPPTQELEDLVNTTERIMDAATAEFLLNSTKIPPQHAPHLWCSTLWVLLHPWPRPNQACRNSYGIQRMETQNEK
jgi:hypothetical protein